MSIYPTDILGDALARLCSQADEFIRVKLGLSVKDYNSLTRQQLRDKLHTIGVTGHQLKVETIGNTITFRLILEGVPNEKD